MTRDYYKIEQAQAETAILQNQVTIMLALRCLLYPYASDHQRQRDYCARLLTEQIEHTCARFHSMPSMPSASNPAEPIPVEQLPGEVCLICGGPTPCNCHREQLP